MHAGCLNDALAHVAVEEAGGGDVSRLEETGERRQPGEALRVGVGAPDEREHLELPSEVGAVVGDHVHEVVLREVCGCAAGRPGQLEAAAVVHLPDRVAQRFLRKVGEGNPARRELGIDLGRYERCGRAATRPAPTLELPLAALLDVLDEAVALQILPRQPVRALGVAARHANEVVLHAERLGILRDPVRDHDRDRSQHQLAEHHVMDDPLPVGEVAPGEHVGELVGPERLERSVVDRDAGERARDRLEQIGLHVGQAGLRRDRGRDPTGDEVHFPDVLVVETGSVCRVQRNEPLSVTGYRAAHDTPLAGRVCARTRWSEEFGDRATARWSVC